MRRCMRGGALCGRVVFSWALAIFYWLLQGTSPAQVASGIEISCFTKGTNGWDLTVETSLSSRMELYHTTSLTGAAWQVTGTGTVLNGTLTVNTPNSDRAGYFVIGNADLDVDEDGVPDAREALVHRTNPHSSDTDGDGIEDGVDTVPLVPGPAISITAPLEGATVYASPINVTGTWVYAGGPATSIEIGGIPSTLSGSNFSCEVPVQQWRNALNVDAVGVDGNASRGTFDVLAELDPPGISVEAPAVSPDDQMIHTSGQWIRLVLCTDTACSNATVNGEDMVQEGYYFYKWVQLGGTNLNLNTVFIQATDMHERTGTLSVDIQFEPPEGDGYDPTADRDGDSIANEADPFPDDGTEWTDADGDGVGDNADTVVALPNASGARKCGPVLITFPPKGYVLR